MSTIIASMRGAIVTALNGGRGIDQKCAFGVHMAAQRADRSLFVVVAALALGECPGGLGQAGLQRVDLFVAISNVGLKPGLVGFEAPVLGLRVLADALGLGHHATVRPGQCCPRGRDKRYDCGDRCQPRIHLYESGPPFAKAFEHYQKRFHDFEPVAATDPLRARRW
jgi:hypothetical protein